MVQISDTDAIVSWEDRKMSNIKISIVFFIIVLASFSPGLIAMAHADNPLKYPPFSWPADNPDQPRTSNRQKTAKPGKTDLYQNKDETKQWYDGDFMGMDDD